MSGSFLPEKRGPLLSQGFIPLLITFLGFASFEKHCFHERFLVSVEAKESEGFVRTLTEEKSLVCFSDDIYVVKVKIFKWNSSPSAYLMFKKHECEGVFIFCI